MRRPLTLVALSAVLLLPSLATAGWEEGVAAFTSKNYRAAAAEFQKLVEQSPDGFQGHYMLGLSLERLNRQSESLQHLRRAHDLQPGDLNVKMALGKSYSANRRYSDAVKVLSSVDASALPSSHKKALYQIRGQSRLKAGDTAGALGDFRALAKGNPSNADLQYVYGTTAFSLDRLDEAIGALGKAHQLAPSDEDKARTYANALIKKGRISRDKAAKKAAYTQAATVARKLVAAAPTYDNYLLRISAELGAGLYNQAVETGKAAIAKNDGDWLAHFYLGQAYSSAGSFAQAEAPLATARSKTSRPEDLKMVWRQLGFVYEKQKKYGASIDAYAQAGDQAGIARVRENQRTAEYNRQVEQENQAIEEMEAEAKAIEEELKKMQAGGGR